MQVNGTVSSENPGVDACMLEVSIREPKGEGKFPKTIHIARISDGLLWILRGLLSSYVLIELEIILVTKHSMNTYNASPDFCGSIT